MLRELHRLLDELHDGLNAIETHGGVRLSAVDMTLPLELRPVFRDGGCVLLADVSRQRAVDEWLTSPSRLVVGWSADGPRPNGPDPRGNIGNDHPVHATAPREATP